MDVLIIRDGGATKLPRTVADMSEVDGLRAAGFEVEVIGGEESSASAAVAVAEPAAKKPAKPKKA